MHTILTRAWTVRMRCRALSPRARSSCRRRRCAGPRSHLLTSPLVGCGVWAGVSVECRQVFWVWEVLCACMLSVHLTRAKLRADCFITMPTQITQSCTQHDCLVLMRPQFAHRTLMLVFTKVDTFVDLSSRVPLSRAFPVVRPLVESALGRISAWSRPPVHERWRRALSVSSRSAVGEL